MELFEADNRIHVGKYDSTWAMMMAACWTTGIVAGHSRRARTDGVKRQPERWTLYAGQEQLDVQ